jgi:predicted ArsR family transcriptional regulator
MRSEVKTLSVTTADELAAHLGITKTAAKEHVVKVEGLGYLTLTVSPRGSPSVAFVSAEIEADRQSRLIRFDDIP